MSIIGMSAVQQDNIEVENLITFVDNLITLGTRIAENKETLEATAQKIKNEAARDMFMTMDEVGLALRCTPEKAAEYLEREGITRHKAGKSYVVNKALFKRHFEEGEKQ
jgi:hypothetical protein